MTYHFLNKRLTANKVSVAVKPTKISLNFKAKNDEICDTYNAKKFKLMQLLTRVPF